MSVEAARLHVTVTSDTDSARRGLLGLGNDVDHTRNRFGSAVGGMAALGAGAFVAIGAAAVGAGVALVKGFASAVGASSDLSETLNKANVVFGQSAKGVIDFGESAARSFGMSKNEAIGAAATFGNLFKTIGIGQEPAANMSKKLVTLASDLASFNNMDPTEVLEKLRSGLSGEVEPLRSMGVFLNEATVKAKAMEMGLADTSGELSEAAKVQARYALILEQTSVAHGDFANTSKGLANQQRILKGQWEDLKAAIGDQLRPALEQAAGSMTERLMPAMQKLAPIIGALAVPVAKVVAEVVDMASTWLGEAGRVDQATGLIGDAFNRAGEGLKTFMSGVQGADAGGFLQTLKDLWESVSPLVGAMTDLGTAIITKLGPELPRVIEALADLAVAITPAFVMLVEALTVAVDKLPGPVVAAAVGMFLFKDGILAAHGALKLLVGSSLLNVLGTKLAGIGMALGGVTTPAAGLGVVGGLAAFAAAGAVLGAKVNDAINGIDVTGAATSLGDRMAGAFSRIPSIIMSPLTPFGSLGLLITTHLGQAIANAGGALGDGVIGLGNKFAPLAGNVAVHLASAGEQWASIMSGAQTRLNDIAGALVAGVAGKFSELAANGASIFSGAVNTWVGIMQGLPGAILGALGDFGSLLVNAGRALIGGLIDGIQSRISDLTNLVGKLAGLIASVKGPLSYDRKLLIPHGEAIMGSLMKGIGGGVPALASQLGGITNAIPTMAGGGFTAGAVPAVARAGGGGVTVNVYPSAGMNEKDLARKVRDEFLRMQHHGFETLISRIRAGVRR